MAAAFRIPDTMERYTAAWVNYYNILYPTAVFPDQGIQEPWGSLGPDQEDNIKTSHFYSRKRQSDCKLLKDA